MSDEFSFKQEESKKKPIVLKRIQQIDKIQEVQRIKEVQKTVITGFDVSSWNLFVFVTKVLIVSLPAAFVAGILIYSAFIAFNTFFFEIFLA